MLYKYYSSNNRNKNKLSSTHRLYNILVYYIKNISRFFKPGFLISRYWPPTQHRRTCKTVDHHQRKPKEKTNKQTNNRIALAQRMFFKSKKPTKFKPGVKVGFRSFSFTQPLPLMTLRSRCRLRSLADSEQKADSARAVRAARSREICGGNDAERQIFRVRIRKRNVIKVAFVCLIPPGLSTVQERRPQPFWGPRGHRVFRAPTLQVEPINMANRTETG